MRLFIAIVTISFLGCGTGGGHGKDTTNDITCFNSQPVQVLTLPSGQVPDISGDGGITSDVQNSDGTHTFTVSGCNFEVTGDVTISDENHNNS